MFNNSSPGFLKGIQSSSLLSFFVKIIPHCFINVDVQALSDQWYVFLFRYALTGSVFGIVTLINEAIQALCQVFAGSFVLFLKDTTFYAVHVPQIVLRPATSSFVLHLTSFSNFVGTLAN